MARRFARCVSPARAAACALLALSSAPAVALDYVVRPDGGDEVACSGRVDRSLAAAAGSRDCAWSHPFIALPPGGTPRIAGGDTLYVRPGSYRMGLGAPGATACHSDWPWDCHMAALPAGRSATQPTRLLGVDAAGQCVQRPQLWGAERAARVLNLDRSDHVEVACLEITDRHRCVENHCHGGGCAAEVARCPRETFPFGDWAGTGLFARDAAGVLLRDLDIHGMALRGIHAGRLRDWRLERVRLVGNGSAGWDGDLGEPDSSNSGSMAFIDVEIAWNGCAEDYPEPRPFACWGQSSGGYGDGLGTAATGGDWLFDGARIHHNASDGLDLLYLRPPATLEVRRSQLHDNAGNQLKAAGTTSIVDSRIDGRCTALGSAGGLPAADHCRAGGDAVVLALWPGSSAWLEGNTLAGQGDCLLVVEGGSADSRVQLRDNRFSGGAMWRGGGKRVCGVYLHGGTARLDARNNAFQGLRNGQCPDGNRCLSASP